MPLGRRRRLDRTADTVARYGAGVALASGAVQLLPGPQVTDAGLLSEEAYTELSCTGAAKRTTIGVAVLSEAPHAAIATFANCAVILIVSDIQRQYAGDRRSGCLSRLESDGVRLRRSARAV
jgi:hypothetical protein